MRRQLATIREMVSRQHQTPTREWPLLYLEAQDVLFVVREWPDGALTAYEIADFSRQSPSGSST